jgi:phosphoribosylglycinamide formyltransferase-1
MPMSIAVLVSGTGSNLQAILDTAAADPDYGAEVVVVIADRAEAGGLARAERAGIPTEVVAWSSFDGREPFTSAVCDAAERHGAEALVLAGFMRILAPVAIDRFPDRIVNVHPALLPAFPGAHAVPQALAHGVKVTGVTVHFLDEEVDHGPIILQRPVPVEPGDDEASLHARIRGEEHRWYPVVVGALASGRLRVEGRIVHWSES